ncbi:MAG TPA: cyclophilin-like fold protein [Sediminibacterium sp.]|jgi:hypothetical protein|nr:MAG: hypothetical protein B7Y76_09290 [Sphingobacteriia bacterium 35-40-5]HQR94816.1 cyclophilin-like fold protein [Sediminibacterium sp.]HQS56672.1 cyclophilin-like fold protein [Sediminibacterium sp.]
MKLLFSLLICFLFVQAQALKPNLIKPSMDPIKIRITAAGKTFTASLANNKTAQAFKNKLPFELKMIELNGNEKYADLSGPIVTNSTNPGKISIGDLMLYGDQTLVVFYKSFSTPYSYTNIGKIDDVAGLAAALGAGNVSVKFEIIN